MLSDRRYCYPLTISDFASRYLIACEALSSTKEDYAFAVFESAFKEFGLPRAIRTDNSVPFASPNALFKLSKLSGWWLRLSIETERIKPSHPKATSSAGANQKPRVRAHIYHGDIRDFTSTRTPIQPPVTQEQNGTEVGPTSASGGTYDGNLPGNSVKFFGGGAQGRNRTTDTVIFSHVLYQLSYLGF